MYIVALFLFMVSVGTGQEFPMKFRERWVCCVFAAVLHVSSHSLGKKIGRGSSFWRRQEKSEIKRFVDGSPGAASLFPLPAVANQLALLYLFSPPPPCVLWWWRSFSKVYLPLLRNFIMTSFTKSTKLHTDQFTHVIKETERQRQGVKLLHGWQRNLYVGGDDAGGGPKYRRLHFHMISRFCILAILS